MRSLDWCRIRSGWRLYYESAAGGFCVVAFLDIDGEVRLKEDRLFASYEAAEEYLKKSK